MKFKILFFFLGLHLSILSQERLNAVFIDSLKIETKTIYEITAGATYFSSNNVFYKKTTDKEFDYTAISLGNLTSVDLYNPLQIVLFYKDFNTVVLIDNQLNETHRIDGNKLETPVNFNTVGLASRNQFWFYDFLTQKIGLYNFNADTYKFISTPIINKILDYNSDYNYFYWLDEEHLLYSITIFGKIKTIGKIPSFDLVKILPDEKYVYKKDDQLYYCTINQNKCYEIIISEKSFDKFYYKNGILSIFTADKVINYKILLP